MNAQAKRQSSTGLDALEMAARMIDQHFTAEVRALVPDWYEVSEAIRKALEAGGSK